MTPILKVITEYCDIYVDDERLKEKKETDAPSYARAMWGYLQPAIALFNIPTEMQDYLVGSIENPKIKEPKFDSIQYKVDEDKTQDFVVELGEEYTEYELCSCRLREEINGRLITRVIDIEYDGELGQATVKVRSGETIKANSVLDFNFYTDGEFENTLSYEIMNILGMCFQVVWTDRFNTDWLSNVSKIEDKSFYEQNRANKMNADTQRLEMLRRKLASEMRRYEQNLYYKKTITSGSRLKI